MNAIKTKQLQQLILTKKSATHLLDVSNFDSLFQLPREMKIKKREKPSNDMEI